MGIIGTSRIISQRFQSDRRRRCFYGFLIRLISEYELFCLFLTFPRYAGDPSWKTNVPPAPSISFLLFLSLFFFSPSAYWFFSASYFLRTSIRARSLGLLWTRVTVGLSSTNSTTPQSQLNLTLRMPLSRPVTPLDFDASTCGPRSILTFLFLATSSSLHSRK